MNRQLSLTGDPAPTFPDLGLVTEGDAWSFAVFSPCRRYRYLLGRAWDLDAPPMTWCMLNPSSATAATAGSDGNDPTIRKCIGFAKGKNCGSIRVVNLAAWRATDPKELRQRGVEVVTHANLSMLRWALARDQGLRVAGWGRIERAVRPRLADSIAAVEQLGGLWCFGKTEKEPFEPRHPLMLAYATPLVSVADGSVFP